MISSCRKTCFQHLNTSPFECHPKFQITSWLAPVLFSPQIKCATVILKAFKAANVPCCHLNAKPAALFFSETLKKNGAMFSHLLMDDDVCLVPRTVPNENGMGLKSCTAFPLQLGTKGENSMNTTFHGAELVEQWRNGIGQDSPAGPLFAAGEFAQADIVNATAKQTGCCLCSGSWTVQCC